MASRCVVETKVSALKVLMNPFNPVRCGAFLPGAEVPVNVGVSGFHDMKQVMFHPVPGS